MARILVIDDEEDVRLLLVRALEAAGHEVRAARDGTHGMQLQREAACEVVVTDIYMPEKDGIETIREMKVQFPGIKIIAITGGGRAAALGGRAATHLGVVAGQLDVDAVLQKPFGTGELLESVECALARDPRASIP